MKPDMRTAKKILESSFNCARCGFEIPQIKAVAWLAMVYIAENRVLKERLEEEQGEDALYNLIFVGSISISHFHRLDCKWAEEIPFDNRVLLTHEEAVRSGYKPCKTCRS